MGAEATLAHYNSADRVYREWLAFIADGGGNRVAHCNDEMLGKALFELPETDGFEATEQGSWMTLEDVNPAAAKWRESTCGWSATAG